MDEQQELDVFRPDPRPGHSIMGFSDLVDPDGQPVDLRTVLRKGDPPNTEWVTTDLRPCTSRSRKDLVGMMYLGTTLQSPSDAPIPEGYRRDFFGGGAWLQRLQDPETGDIVEVQCTFINMGKFGPETVARMRAKAKAQ